MASRSPDAAYSLRFAAKPYPTGRTKATGREVIVCYCGDGTWPHEWRPNGGGARIFACYPEAPIRRPNDADALERIDRIGADRG